MIKKVKLTFVSTKTTKKVRDDQGNEVEVPLVYKKGKNMGKNFLAVSIKTAETGEEFYNNYCLPGEKSTLLKVDDVVTLKLTETKSKNEDGSEGDYVFRNFSIPSQKEVEAYNDAMSGK